MTAARATGRPRPSPLRPWPWIGAACLLAVPAVAMWLGVPGVEWTASDFVVMGLLLAGACGLFTFGARLGGGSAACRAGFGLAALTGFLTAWVCLAVGMLGSEGHPANLMFAGVLAVAVAGALLARFRPRGMARAMAAAGVAQLLAACAAAAMGGFETMELVLTACFALPWWAAGGLFAIGARAPSPRRG